jgi:hypothetical protein
MRTIRMHRQDCVLYLLMNNHVIVEWWVEYKVACDVQWLEDMHMWQSVAWLILVCGCNFINCSKKISVDVCTKNLSCPGAGKPSMICCSKWLSLHKSTMSHGW